MHAAPSRAAYVRTVLSALAAVLLASCIVTQTRTNIAPSAAPGGGVPEDLPEGTRYVGPGADATTYLRSDRPRLVVEIDQAAGRELTPEAVDHLRRVLGSVLDKPDGIEVTTSTFEPDRAEYSAQDLLALDRERRDVSEDARTAVMYVLALNGRFRDQPQAVGTAYSATGFAVFVEQMTPDGVSAGAAQAQRAVLVHEAGHLLSLVNIGYTSPRDREDPDHPNHSTNERSVMHWAVQTVSVLDLGGGGPPDDFDADDRADLQAVKDGSLTIDFTG